MSAAAAPLVVGGLLLAGGRGRRFGSGKRAALLPDGTTFRRIFTFPDGEEDHAA